MIEALYFWIKRYKSLQIAPSHQKIHQHPILSIPYNLPNRRRIRPNYQTPCRHRFQQRPRQYKRIGQIHMHCRNLQHFFVSLVRHFPQKNARGLNPLGFHGALWFASWVHLSVRRRRVVSVPRSHPALGFRCRCLRGLFEFCRGRLRDAGYVATGYM